MTLPSPSGSKNQVISFCTTLKSVVCLFSRKENVFVGQFESLTILNLKVCLLFHCLLTSRLVYRVMFDRRLSDCCTLSSCHCKAVLCYLSCVALTLFSIMI